MEQVVDGSKREVARLGPRLGETRKDQDLVDERESLNSQTDGVRTYFPFGFLASAAATPFARSTAAEKSFTHFEVATISLLVPP